MTDKSSLHELLKRIGNGDSTAFDVLYERMRQPLCNKLTWTYRNSLTKEDAEDIVQNTFIIIAQHASSYQGLHTEASARNWMNKIAFNEALKVINMDKRLTNTIDDDGDGYPPPRNPTVPGGSRRAPGSIQEGRRSVEEYVERSISLQKIASSVRRLTVEEQNMFSLRFEEEHTFEEIGHEIGRTKPRAKQIVDGVVAKIRKALGVASSRC